jgi:hypothetical protein
MAKKEKPEREAGRAFAVGDKIEVKLHDGRVVDATVRAIVDDGDKLQIDFGHNETLVKASQIVD